MEIETLPYQHKANGEWVPLPPVWSSRVIYLHQNRITFSVTLFAYTLGELDLGDMTETAKAQVKLKLGLFIYTVNFVGLCI